MLGAILFIMHVFDAPPSIKPKYADDFATVAVENSLAEVESKLQTAVDDLVAWSDVNDMILNETKTKDILFRKNVNGLIINLSIRSRKIEQKEWCIVHRDVLFQLEIPQRGR